MKTISRIVSVVGRKLAIILACVVLGSATNAWAVSLVSKSYMDGETVYHTTNGVTVMSGWLLPEGTTVRLSARGDKDFLRWIGDVPEGVDATSREIDVTLGTEDLQITPLYNKMWVVDNLETQSGNTVTGMIYCVERGITNWSMRIQVNNKSKRYLQLGRSNHDLRTAIAGELDLSTPIIDTEGNLWMATSIYQSAFTMPDEKNTLTTSIIVPRTLTKLDGQSFNNTLSALTNLVLDCPEVTGTSGTTLLNGCGNLKTLTVKLPRLEGINKSSFNDKAMAGMDVTEWDFSSVRKMVQPDSWAAWVNNFSGKQFTGTIRLPKMETFLTNDFYNTKNLLAAEVGTVGNTLKTLGVNTFHGTCGIKSLTIGGAEGWFAHTNSVTFANGLAQVVFLSTPPTMVEEDGTFVNGTDKADFSVCFYIPEDNQEAWTDVIAQIDHDYADAAAKIAEFSAVHPDAESPKYVLKAGVLGTKYRQFLGWSVRTTKVVCHVGDPRFGGRVTVEPNKTYFKEYENVTLTAHPAAGTTFTRWTGLPTGVTNCYDSTITFKVGDKPIDVTMWAGPDWTYVAEDNLITNKVWKLNVSAVSGSISELKIGSSAFYSGYTGYGEGILDLSGKVYDAEDSSKEWTITEFGSGVFRTQGKSVENIWVEVMTGLVIPRTLTTIGTRQGWSGQWFNCNAGGSKLETLILDAPDYKGSFNSYSFNMRGSKLTNVVVNLPGLTTLDGQSAFECDSTCSNIDTWNLSGLKTINTGGLGIAGVRSGTLHLESLTTLATKALASKGVTGYEFGTGYEPKSNAKLSLASFALSNSYNLVSIKFGPYAEINLADDTAFVKCAALRKIVFEGRPVFAMSVVDNLLCEAAPLTEQTEPVVIYASKALGWDKVDRFVPWASLSPEEQALKPIDLDEPSAQVIGAFKCADESKRAWLVNYRSRFDPKGTLLIVR